MSTRLVSHTLCQSVRLLNIFSCSKWINENKNRALCNIFNLNELSLGTALWTASDRCRYLWHCLTCTFIRFWDIFVPNLLIVVSSATKVACWMLETVETESIPRAAFETVLETITCSVLRWCQGFNIFWQWLEQFAVFSTAKWCSLLNGRKKFVVFLLLVFFLAKNIDFWLELEMSDAHSNLFQSPEESCQDSASFLKGEMSRCLVISWHKIMSIGNVWHLLSVVGCQTTLKMSKRPKSNVEICIDEMSFDFYFWIGRRTLLLSKLKAIFNVVWN